MAKLVSKTYGEALFELAVEEGREDAFLTEIVALREVLKENPDFNKLMNHPKILKEEKPVVEKAIPAEAMVIKKKETKEGIVCEIVTELDCDEIRYNVGSKKVTEKNKSRCKRYEGKFTLEEPAVINASAFKEDILVCSVQG